MQIRVEDPFSLYPVPSFGLSLGFDLAWPISIYIYCLNAIANEVTVYFEQQVQTPISSFSLNMQGGGGGGQIDRRKGHL